MTSERAHVRPDEGENGADYYVRRREASMTRRCSKSVFKENNNDNNKVMDGDDQSIFSASLPRASLPVWNSGVYCQKRLPLSSSQTDGLDRAARRHSCIKIWFHSTDKLP